MAKSIVLTCNTPDQTCVLARVLGSLLHAGDTVLLDGPIGAGKTHFARCLIQSRLRVAEDVPSPTFTLVQTYETDGPDIWHSDLYRLSGPSEVPETGLTEAFETAICLIEWPDRLGDLAPGHALHMRFDASQNPDHRLVTISWKDPRWNARLSGLMV